MNPSQWLSWGTGSKLIDATAVSTFNPYIRVRTLTLFEYSWVIWASKNVTIITWVFHEQLSYLESSLLCLSSGGEHQTYESMLSFDRFPRATRDGATFLSGSRDCSWHLLEQSWQSALRSNFCLRILIYRFIRWLQGMFGEYMRKKLQLENGLRTFKQ